MQRAGFLQRGWRRLSSLAGMKEFACAIGGEGYGVQYVALPQYGWERIRGEKLGTYENSVSLPAADSGLWFHVRIEVSPAQVRTFVNGSTMPCLVVNNLLTTNTTGSVGVFMGTGSRGIFSNLKAKSARK